MAVRGLILFSVLSCFLAACYGEVFLSKLPKTLVVTTNPTGAVSLTAGKSQITVTWGLNPTLATTDTSTYKTVKVKLCYEKVSQKDRPWRKTVDDLVKDKTCQHKVAAKPFNTSQVSVTYTVQKDVPSANYFVRAYAFDASDKQVAYGDTVDTHLTVTGITGRHASLDIAAAAFSTFSVVALAFFFYREKKKSK